MRMGVGVGEAAGTAPSLSMLSDYVPRERRARSLSVISIGAVMGLGLGMIVGGYLNEWFNWRVAFLAAGIPGMVLAVVMRLTVREPARGASEEGSASTEGESFLDSLRYLFSLRTYRFILGANAFSLFAAMGRNLWEPEFLIRIYELGSGSAGFWYFITSPLPSALGIYLGGNLADRLGARDTRWYLWVPALGQLVSVPILVSFPALARERPPDRPYLLGLDRHLDDSGGLRAELGGVGLQRLLHRPLPRDDPEHREGADACARSSDLLHGEQLHRAHLWSLAGRHGL